MLKRNTKFNKIKRERPKINRQQATKGRKLFERINTPLLILVITLLIVGLLMIFSSSAVLAYVNYNQDTFYFFKRQLVWIIVGIIAAFIMYILPSSTIKKVGIGLLITSFILMIYMLPEALSPLGADGKTKLIEIPLVATKEGATRWISLGFFDIQPAEFAKVGMIIFSAAWFTMSTQTKNKIEKWINKYKKNEYIHLYLRLQYLLFPVTIIGFVSLFVIGQRDLDTIVIIVLTFIAMYYTAGENKAHSLITKLLLIGSGVIGTAAMVFEKYRRERLNSFLEIFFKGEPKNKLGGSFQVWNGLIALGTGGLWGLGYGESRQKLFFLNEAAYTDSIFAVFAEEFGLIGSLLLIFAFIYFLSIGLQIAINSKDKFLSFIALGITSWIAIQSFLHIAANLALIPFGGMPLPFISYGGSTTIMLLMSVGLLLNASRESNDIKQSRRSDSIRNLHLAK
jgi:cell division protein FtsW